MPEYYILVLTNWVYATILASNLTLAECNEMAARIEADIDKGTAHTICAKQGVEYP
jgi:hypothetical protein